MKKRQLIFLVVFLLVCLVIVISVIASVTLDAAANKGKIVSVPESTQTAVSDGSKWLYCGADSKFLGEVCDPGATGESSEGCSQNQVKTRTCQANSQWGSYSSCVSKRTKCGASDKDWRSCQTTTSLTGDIEFDHTGAGCRQKCGELGYLSWGMWSWDNEDESTCWCGDGKVTPHHCTYRAGTCKKSNDIRECKYAKGQGTNTFWMRHSNNYDALYWESKQITQIWKNKDPDHYGKYYDSGGYRYSVGSYAGDTTTGVNYEICRIKIDDKLLDCDKDWDCDIYCQENWIMRNGLCGDEDKCACEKESKGTCDSTACQSKCHGRGFQYGLCDFGECKCFQEEVDHSCFVAGTKITMADGSLKNIEDVKVGDKVTGRNKVNTVFGYKRPIIGSRSTYIINGKVEFTGDHPFLSEEGWKVADLELYYGHPRDSDIEPTQLKVGDVLVREKGEEIIKTLEKRKTRPADEIVYDLELDEDNTYIADGYVVHNCGHNG